MTFAYIFIAWYDILILPSPLQKFLVILLLLTFNPLTHGGF